MSETELWLAVLHRAVLDARLEPDTGPMTQREAQEVQAARIYLTTYNRGLSAVCAMADVDMAALIDRMKLRVAEAEQLRITAITPKAKPDQPQKRTRKLRVEFEGESLTIKQVSERMGSSLNLIYTRLRKGLPLDAPIVPGRFQRKRIAQR